MSNDSHLFYTYSQLVDKGAKLEGNKFLLNNQFYVPLYEGKMIWHYNHHFGTINEGTKEKPARQMAMPTSDELKIPIIILCHGIGFPKRIWIIDL